MGPVDSDSAEIRFSCDESCDLESHTASFKARAKSQRKTLHSFLNSGPCMGHERAPYKNLPVFFPYCSVERNILWVKACNIVIYKQYISGRPNDQNIFLILTWSSSTDLCSQLLKPVIRAKEFFIMLMKVALYPTQVWGLFSLRTNFVMGGLELSVPIPFPSGVGVGGWGGRKRLKVQNISSQWPMI